MSYPPPLFECGEIIDIRDGNVMHVRMPDRVGIEAVYRKTKSNDWLYYVLSEQSNKYVYMSQKKLYGSQSKRTAECYKDKIVTTLYDNGFRFVSNESGDKLDKLLKTLSNMSEIKSVITVNPAIYPNGTYADEHIKGVWVKYNITISNNNITLGDIDHTVIK